MFLQKAKPQHSTNAVIFIKQDRKRKKTEEKFSALTLWSVLPVLIFIYNR